MGQRVPWRGLEPPRPYGHSILNAARLPVPPPGQGRRDTLLRLKVPRLNLMTWNKVQPKWLFRPFPR